MAMEIDIKETERQLERLREVEEQDAAERRRQLVARLLAEIVMDEASKKVDPKIAEHNQKFVRYFEDDFLSGRGPHGDWQGSSQVDRLAITQKFADARVLAKWTEFQKQHAGEKVVFGSPVAGNVVVTSPFGHRCAAGCSGNHPGADLAVPGGGSPNIVAAADGIVLFAGRYSGYGNAVIIGHADGTQTLYAHMADASLVPEMGQTIKQGQKLGVMGATGQVTGVHLHFEHRDGKDAIAPTIAGLPLTRNRSIAMGEGTGQNTVAAKVTPAEKPESQKTADAGAIPGLSAGFLALTPHDVAAPASPQMNIPQKVTEKTPAVIASA